MATTHNLGFPRIGPQRELKKACEAYWQNTIGQSELLGDCANLLTHNLKTQQESGLDWLQVGDFSLYDHVLDASFLVGNLPQRIRSGSAGNPLDDYFRLARGRAPQGEPCFAAEMTKWFDTNYHYLVPEFDLHTTFSLHAERLLQQIAQARHLADAVKPVILGPLSYLWLGKYCGASSDPHLAKLDLLELLVPVYRELLVALHGTGVTWVQIDEPILTLDLPHAWRQAFEATYHRLQVPGIQLLLTTYFGPLGDNLSLAVKLPVAGLHVDAVRGRGDLPRLLDILPIHKVLSLGVIDGRNIWRSDLSAILDWLEPIAQRLGDRLWLAPSSSLLHVPIDLSLEDQLDGELTQWLAFARQKLVELQLLKRAVNEGREVIAEELAINRAAALARRQSTQVHNPEVAAALARLEQEDDQRPTPFQAREQAQREVFKLPLYPTTTIGSFPQTQDIREQRRAFKDGKISLEDYNAAMKAHIHTAIIRQEELDIDVLVHGEAERNDMVEYFAEYLQGYAFTQYAWVQSYGSRCVKPPIIYGDVTRPRAFTVEWARYAQSLTNKPVKGMLTGPITLLQWAFVRDDQPRSTTALQIALALREEILDLEAAGIGIIQVDEPALREGLPLRQDQWQDYLAWAVRAFKVAVNKVRATTQIHTHMCYAEFSDILPAIAALDADVITIETSRSNMTLLDDFRAFAYPNGIGPGVYDIHSPNVPSVAQIVGLLHKAASAIPPERLWVNPDCGLKTRNWPEVQSALTAMVSAAKELRAQAI